MMRPAEARLKASIITSISIKLSFAVLTGVAEVGHHGGDAAGGSPLESVDHNEHFHQIVVHRLTGGLDHENVGAADGLIDGDKIFPVGETAHLGVTQGDVQVLTDGLCQRAVGVSGKDLDVRPMCDQVTDTSLNSFFISCPPKGTNAPSLLSYFNFPSARRLSAQPSRFFCFSLATAREPAGTSWVMVEPAAVYAPSPTVTGATRLVLHPRKT